MFIDAVIFRTSDENDAERLRGFRFGGRSFEHSVDFGSGVRSGGAPLR